MTNNKKNENKNKNNKSAIYSIFTILVFLLLVTVAGTKIIQDRNEQNKLSELENSAYEDEIDIGRDTENIADEQASAQTDTTSATKEEAAEETTAPTTQTTATKEVTVSLKDIANPVSKTKITMAYSYNTDPVFSVTLNEYRSDHMGIDISAEIGENVKAAFDGTVEKIYIDGKLGQCIVLKHGSNIKTVYANLDKTISVKVGQTVKQGAIIAKVGDTAAFEIDDPSHLHFEVWQNDKSVDPTQYIK
jgi:murein DD-endopeptidase MepM/ murein hydrolase activator NlpD